MSIEQTKLKDHFPMIRVINELGPFKVMEYQRDLSVTPSSAALAYYCNEMNVRKRQVVCQVGPANITLQETDSSSGMSALAEGACDIGMASRELKDSELEAGLIPTVIAMDGIAVVVNHENPVNGLKREEVKAIYMGELDKWSEIPF